MEVSAWKNGRFAPGKPLSLGVSVGRGNAKRFFDKKWAVVLIEFDGTTVPVKLTSGFWAKCPELRSSAIGDWMKRKGLAPWKTGEPPKMSLVPQDGNRFRLSV